jgi:hypothetical protein
MNVRLLCPRGATVPDHVSLFGPDVVLGVVGVLFPPHAAANSASMRTNPEPRIPNPDHVMGE